MWFCREISKAYQNQGVVIVCVLWLILLSVAREE